MSTVNLELSEYESLKRQRYAANKKCREIENKMNELLEGGKVDVVTTVANPYSPLNGITIVEIKGLDSVKAEVMGFYQQGLIDEEIKRQQKEIEEHQKKVVSELKNNVQNLQAEIDELRSRSLWKRIFNR